MWVLAAIGGAACLVGIAISGPAVAYARWARLSVGTGTSRTVTLPANQWRRALVVGQIALSIVLLFIAGLFTRNLASLHTLSPGYAPANVVWSRLDLPVGKPKQIDQVGYYRPLLEKLKALPGVTGVAIASALPTRALYQVVGLSPFRRGDAQPSTGEVGGTFDYISPGFFAALKVRLDGGREFDWSDTVGHPPVAIINRALADKLFPRHDAVEARLRVSSSVEAAVVGVAPSISIGDCRLRNLPAVYMPFLQVAGYLSPTLILSRSSR